MATTVTPHVNGLTYLYENEDGDKLEVNAEDHYLIKKGICYINWDSPEIVVRREDKYTEYKETISKKMYSEVLEKEKLDSLAGKRSQPKWIEKKQDSTLDLYKKSHQEYNSRTGKQVSFDEYISMLPSTQQDEIVKLITVDK